MNIEVTTSFVVCYERTSDSRGLINNRNIVHNIRKAQDLRAGRGVLGMNRADRQIECLLTSGTGKMMTSCIKPADEVTQERRFSEPRARSHTICHGVASMIWVAAVVVWKVDSYHMRRNQ